MFADNPGYPESQRYNPVPELAECEFCGRSTISRFGGTISNECDSCADEFDLLTRSGKLEVGENLEDFDVRRKLVEHGLLPRED